MYKMLPEGDPSDDLENNVGRSAPLVDSCNNRESVLEKHDEVIAQSRQGIPTPEIPRFQCLLCCRWCLVVVLVPGIVYSLCLFMTTQDKFLLDMKKDVMIDLTNCDLVVEESKDRASTVRLQHWNAFGRSSMENSTTQEGKNVLVIKMKMRLKIPMFRCRLTFSVHAEESLPAIRGRVLGGSHSLVTLNAVPAKEVSLKLGLVLVKCTVLPEKLILEVDEGNIFMRLDSRQTKTMTSVTSRHAVLDVESSEAIAVQLKGLARKTCLLSGGSITDHDDLVHLSVQGSTTATPKIHITYDTAEETPAYFQVGNGFDKSLKTRRGKLQQREKPFLNRKSQTDLGTMSTWMQSAVNKPAPWVARLHVIGPGFEHGSWQLLSSEAFLSLPLQWFMLLSAGMIHPTIQDANVQMLSLRQQWPPRPPDTTEDIDHMHWAIFEVLRPFVANLTKATIAWVPTDGEPVIFTKDQHRWTATQRDVRKKQSLLFLIALGANLCASVVGASFLMSVLRNQLQKVTKLRHDTVEMASSHRVACTRSSSSTDWKVMAVQVDWPNHAVLLRWSKRTGSQTASYFWIYAKPGQSMHVGESEVCIERIPADKVVVQESSVILEFAFLIHGGKGGADFTAPHGLKYNHRYRFKVVGYNKEENPIDESAWSDEVTVMPDSTLFDMPFLFLKAFFPVPTPSLRYFIEKHCQRFLVTPKASHYNGVIPQHIIVLQNIKVEFHRNFGDFKQREKKFYLAVHVGEGKVECQKETDKCRCVTYARTEAFEAKKFFFSHVDNDEQTQHLDDEKVDDKENRTQKLDSKTVLKVGSINSAMQQLTFTLNFECNDEDAAEGTLDFEELFYSFDEEHDMPEKNETVEVYLKVESKKEFDEDYLCCIKAKVSFESNIVDCPVLPRGRRLFLQDAPGQMFYQGVERLMTWDEKSALLENVNIFAVHAIYNDNTSEEIQVASGIKKETVGFTFMVDLPPSINEDFAVCQLELRGKTNNSEDVKEVVKSHKFVILRTWTLCDMELMYAAFCKMNGMPMERVTQESLSELGVSTTTAPLRVVPSIRAPFAFEKVRENTVIESPGAFHISKSSITLKPGNLEEFPSGPEISSSDSGKRATKKSQTLLPTNQRIEIMEHVWCRKTGRKTMLQYGTGWEPSFLLKHAFYPVDNLLRSLERLAEVLSLKSAYEMFAGWVSKPKADLCLEIAISPIEGTLPYFCEAVLFVLQLVTFCSFPIMMVFFAMLHEFLKHSSSNSIVALSRELNNLHAAYIPDVLFSVHISGQDIWCWMKRLPPISKIMLLASAISLATILVLIFESNFLGNFHTAHLWKSVHKQLNKLGILVISSYLWIALGIFLTWVLWFLMAVVIYPEQMLAVLAFVAGMGVVCFSIYQKAASTQEKIRTQLNKEVPDVLEMICHDFLVDYDRTHALNDKRREIKWGKVQALFWEQMAKYLKDRFKDVEGLKSCFPDTDTSGAPAVPAGTIVNRIFNRALVRTNGWKVIEKSEQAIEKAMDPAAREQAEQELSGLETTTQVLSGMALQHDDQLQYSHYEVRKKLLNPEDEAGGEKVHVFRKELREKLMDVYVRVIENVQKDEEVVTLFEAPEAPRTLARAMAGAHRQKLEIFKHGSQRKTQSETERENSLLKSLIQDINVFNLQGVYRKLAEHLDEALDQTKISQHVTHMLETKLPREIKKQLKLVTNEQKVGSAMHTLFTELRQRKMEAHNSPEKLQNLFKLAKSDKITGLMQTLLDIGLLDKTVKEDGKKEYRKSVHKKLKKLLDSWRVSDERPDEVDSAEAEEFVRDMVQGQIWWGALKDLLYRIGFPIASAASPKYLEEQVVMETFEKFTSKDGLNGLLPEEQLPDFLQKVTTGRSANVSYGMMWKAQMIMLLNEVGVCGAINMKWKEDKGKQEQTVLQEYADYEWPEWLENEWQGSTARSEHGLFIGKSDIQQFINRVAFFPEFEDATIVKEGKGFEPVDDDDYDNWFSSRQPVHLWVKRGKRLLRIRGIWYECFAAVLDKMENGIAKKKDCLRCFQEALKTVPDAESDGLLKLDFFINTWLWEFLVENDHCTLPVFKAALKKAELTLPPQVVDQIFDSADKAEDKRKEGSSRRQIRSLADRVVMYLAAGLPQESTQVLVFDHLGVHSLQELGKLHVARCFRKVDEKTGVCGFIHPREVMEMLKLMACDGMSLKVLEDCFKRLRCQFPEGSIKAAYAVLDTNGDDVIDLSEFLCLIDYIITIVIPHDVIKKLGRTPQQMVIELILTFATLCMVFLFIFISLGAFQVNVSDSASGPAATLIRACVGVVAALGLRFEKGVNDDTKLSERVREHFHAMLGVTSTQVDSWLRIDHVNTSQQKNNRIDYSKSRSSTKDDEDDDEKEGGQDKTKDNPTRNQSKTSQSK